MQARKRFAQHFLEPAWVQKLVHAIAPEPDDVFIEIGPGRGALTAALAARVRHITAIELDRDLVARLRDELPANVDLIEADVLQVDLHAAARELAARGHRVRLVGNLPYNISSPILRQITELARQEAPVVDATVMLQEEVARRVCGHPDTRDWGPLSLGIQLRAEARIVLALPPGAFRPAPKVHSSVVRLRFRAPVADVGDESAFDGVVRAIFGQRRKNLANALKPIAHAHGLDPKVILAAACLDERRRPETLSIEEMARLTRRLAER
ncbi:MAG: 16S rRNA (adenine(1518)-N(6)/adenine(1519)-N(6))-dimethyltransferase RsmA [Vicinamibacterales bacterium]